MKKYFLIFFFSLLLNVFYVSNIQAQEQPVEVILFHYYDCIHCQAENKFLDNLEKDYGDKISVKRYEVSESGNIDLKQTYHDKYNLQDVKVGAVPITFIGDKAFTGFDDEQGIGAEIKAKIDSILAGENNSDTKKTISTVFNLPILGKTDLKTISLPALSVVIGTLDGFNPCAMWVLVFLITLLLGMQEKSKRWLLGSTFILASGAVYFLFMAAWMNMMLFLGYINWIRAAIGIFGIISGILFFRDYWKNKDGNCKVINTDKKKKVMYRLREIVKSPNLLLAMGGIILLAFTVNVVELACSLGFPAVFTQILASSNLASWQYYGYILLYLFFFMIDDLIVFGLAMITLKFTTIGTKYSKYSSLVGGVLIFIIGILLIFKPSWLMFN